MIYLFPTAMLIGGMACIATGQALAGVILCFFGVLLFQEVVEKDKE